MEPNALEEATTRLRKLLREKVPDLLLQAECGGGLELPTPLPWGFASTPTLYELADTAERELYALQAQLEASSRRRGRGVEEESPHGGRQSNGGHDAAAQPGWAAGQWEGAPGHLLCGREQRRQHRSPMGPENGEPAALDGDREGDGRLGGAPATTAGQGGGSSHLGPDRYGAGERSQRRNAVGPREEEGLRDMATGDAGLGAGVESPSAAAPGGSGGAAAAAVFALGDSARACAGEARGGDAATPNPSAAGPDRPDPNDREHGWTPGGPVDQMRPGMELAPPPPPRTYACASFLESLAQSRSFRSPHCEAAMAEVMGMSELYDGLAGSTLGPPPGRWDLEALRSLLKDHINSRWALEAVKQGVSAAKQGNYADAHKAYARALELDPRSAEAYVARGAAHANQRAYSDAERDLRHALSLEPGHRNAAAYLDAVMRKVEEQRQQLEALEEERQQVLARQRATQQQQQQRDRGRRRRTAGAEAGFEMEEGGRTGGGRGAAGAEGSPWGAIAEASGPMGHDPRYGPQGPPSAPGRLQREQAGGAASVQEAGWAAEGAGGRRRRGSNGSSCSESSGSSSGSGRSSGGTPGQAPSLQPGSDDIRRALEVVLKAREHKKKSKHKKQKKKQKKSKRRRRD